LVVSLIPSCYNLGTSKPAGRRVRAPPEEETIPIMMRPSRVILRVIASPPVLLPVAFAFLLTLACGKVEETTLSAPPAASSEPPAAASQVSPEDEALQRMMKEFEIERYEDVVAGAKDFEGRFPASPKLPQVLYISGRASIGKGDFAQGVSTLQRMLAKYPEDENAPFADFYVAQGIYLQGYQPFSLYKIEFQEALPHYEKAMEAFRAVEKKYAGDPEVSTRASLMAAQVLYDMRKPEEALAAFRAYLDKEPHGQYADQAMFQVGAILAETERNDEAKQAYLKLAKEFPGTLSAGTAQERLAELNLIGQRMPPIEIAGWVNRELDVSSLKGKVVVITFWNISCLHCQHEMPKIEALYRNLAPRGLVMIGITHHSNGQNNQLVSNFIHEKGLTFPIGVDSNGVTTASYAVSRIPATAIIDRRGFVRWRNSGALLTQALIESYLK
jgi:TolA-binding protein